MQDEHEFDFIRDTLDIRFNDRGMADITRHRWTSAKKDDPHRPVNKVAGQWGSQGAVTVVGEFQASDTTIRVQEPLTGRLRILSFDFDKNILKDVSFKGTERLYKKIPE